jgi:hypothetical protein
MDSPEDLAKKVKVLEREMALQQSALERLRAMGAERRVSDPRGVRQPDSR